MTVHDRINTYFQILADGMSYFHGTSAEAARYIEQHGFGTNFRSRGMAPGASEVMRSLTYVTKSKSVAKWYATQNVGHKAGAIIEIRFEPRPYTVIQPVTIYGALHDAGAELDVPFAKPGTQLLDVPKIVSALVKAGYNCVHYKDRDANRRDSTVVLTPSELMVTRVHYLRAKQ